MSFHAKPEDYPKGSRIRAQLEAAATDDPKLADRFNGRVEAAASGARKSLPPGGKSESSTAGPERTLALGRLPSGAMNKTEAAYAELLEQRRQAGEVLWYRFEGIKLRLADNTFLTVDFAVLAADNVLEMHEVKGFMQEDANVKLKVAASMYPFRFSLIRKRAKKNGGGWDIREVGCRE